MRSLGAFHAAWWQDAALGTDEDPFRIRAWFSGRSAFEDHVRRREREWGVASAVAGDALSPEARGSYQHALASLPSFWSTHLAERVTQRRNLTLLHGDCYFTNWLYSPDTQRAVLVDFDSASAGPPTFDLVFLVAMFWTRDQRVANEGRALRTYHQALTDSGVAYSWRELVEDYRTMLALIRFDVILDIANGSSPAYWKPKLKCLHDAWTDWRDDVPVWVGD